MIQQIKKYKKACLGKVPSFRHKLGGFMGLPFYKNQTNSQKFKIFFTGFQNINQSLQFCLCTYYTFGDKLSHLHNKRR